MTIIDDGKFLLCLIRCRRRCLNRLCYYLFRVLYTWSSEFRLFLNYFWLFNFYFFNWFWFFNNFRLFGLNLFYFRGLLNNDFFGFLNNTLLLIKNLGHSVGNFFLFNFLINFPCINEYNEKNDNCIKQPDIMAQNFIAPEHWSRSH